MTHRMHLRPRSGRVGAAAQASLISPLTWPQQALMEVVGGVRCWGEPGHPLNYFPFINILFFFFLFFKHVLSQYCARYDTEE